MKLFNDDMQVAQVGNFNFSGVRPDRLGATEYTLVSLIIDKTGSVDGFEGELLNVKRAVVEACQKSPRANYLMLRSVEFNATADEVHGFVELASIDASTYVAPACFGATALYDATYAGIAATNEYAKSLADNEFGANGIVIVVTDGDDNASAQSARSVAAEMSRGVQSEWLESLVVILVGVNASRYKRQLEAFQKTAGIAQYVDIGDATPEKLARLADFVSRSISAQSASLGTGGASQALIF